MKYKVGDILIYDGVKILITGVTLSWNISPLVDPKNCKYHFKKLDKSNNISTNEGILLQAPVDERAYYDKQFLRQMKLKRIIQ